VIAAAPDGLWVGTAGGARRFVARCGRDPGVRAASRELHAFLLAVRDDDCAPSVDVGGAPGADFYDLLASMEAARQAGFGRIGMSGANDLIATFPAAPGAGDRAPPDCPPAAAAQVALEAPVHGTRALGEDQAGHPVIVSVESETISVNGKPASAVTASSLGLIPDLARALPSPAANPIVVITGDRHLDAAIVARVVRTLSASGYQDIRFALARR
jgi:biopolymer transport protein ExbD